MRCLHVYLKFLKLQNKLDESNRSHIRLVPNAAVDVWWSAHLLRPSLYAKFCSRQFGADRLIDRSDFVLTHPLRGDTTETAKLWRAEYNEEYAVPPIGGENIPAVKPAAPKSAALSPVTSSKEWFAKYFPAAEATELAAKCTAQGIHTADDLQLLSANDATEMGFTDVQWSLFARSLNSAGSGGGSGGSGGSDFKKKPSRILRDVEATTLEELHDLEHNFGLVHLEELIKDREWLPAFKKWCKSPSVVNRSALLGYEGQCSKGHNLTLYKSGVKPIGPGYAEAEGFDCDGHCKGKSLPFNHYYHCDECTNFDLCRTCMRKDRKCSGCNKAILPAPANKRLTVPFACRSTYHPTRRQRLSGADLICCLLSVQPGRM